MFLETIANLVENGWHWRHLEDILVAILAVAFLLTFLYFGAKAIPQTISEILQSKVAGQAVQAGILAGILLVPAFAAMAYYSSRPTYLECNVGFGTRAYSGNNTKIWCSNPMLDITCVKGSFVKIGEEVSCVGGDRSRYSIKDNTSANYRYCLERHGELSEATGKNVCRCKLGAAMQDEVCIDLKRIEDEVRSDLDSQCKVHDPHAIAKKKQDGEWGCVCEAGYLLVRKEDGEQECLAAENACPKLYGEGAKAAPFDSSSCVCRDSYEWNADKSGCLPATNW
jgi:hypothetical protein